MNQALWIGFDGLDAEAVPLDLAPGGIIPFGRNLDPDPERGPARLKALLDGLQSRWGANLPLAVALDQEGGAVSRLKPWVGGTPSFRAVWERGGGGACEAWGRLWGTGLGLLGFNVDFAPVADLWTGIEGTGIGNRAASSDPASVASAAGAFLHGLESTGVRGCLKHFPGLGGTKVDSHQALPELDDEVAIRRNAVPFSALSNEDRLVMVAHLKTPATSSLPASMHRGSVAENPWGVRGRFLPDDLEMGGCTDWSWEDRVRLCLEAGHEWLLVCQSEQGVRACADALARQPETLRQRAVARSRSMRKNLLRPQPGPLDQVAWKAWVERVRIASDGFDG
ncbi:MAG: glycoside hydrolase family 3 protein [Holophagaceae bacterium]|nr:glycoside hydrolase family 3 protein [Holophagaceae bacterium]